MITDYYEHPLAETNREWLKAEAAKDKNITGFTLEVVLRSANYYTSTFSGTMDDAVTGLYYHLKLERPLIAMIASKDTSIRHYVVITGFDPVKKLIVVNDPVTGERVYPTEKFEAGWRRANFFALMAMPTANDNGNDEDE